MSTQPPAQADRSFNRSMLIKLFIVALMMFGFGFALIPMYRAICQITGINNLLDGSDTNQDFWVKGLIKSWLGVGSDKILFSEHHLSHAAAALLTAPTYEAAILTADGVGEWATLSIGRGRRGRARGPAGGPAGGPKVELLREIRFPHSLGMLYSTFTAFLGFPVNEGEYKVMGLASYGEPRFADVRVTLSSKKETATDSDG